jgi:hypothetical protein
MQRAILLRFHKDPEIIQNRIDILNHFNPEIPSYGLFGGTEEEFPLFQNLKDIEHVYLLDIKERDTKWRFSDHCVLQWYSK